MPARPVLSRRRTGPTVLLTWLAWLLLLPWIGPAYGGAAAPQSAAPSRVAPAAAAPAVTPAGPVGLVLDTVEPAVATVDSGLRLSGSITNHGGSPVQVEAIAASTAYRGLDTRGAVAAWADGTSTVTANRTLGRDDISSQVAPGAQVPFLIVVPVGELAPTFDLATLPLLLEVVGDGGASIAALHTFVGWDGRSTAAPNPIPFALLVPLTLPPNPNLTSADAEARAAAWVRAVGPGSRLEALAQAVAGTEVTVMVDPAVLAPPDPVDTLTASRPPLEDEEEAEDEEVTEPAPTPQPATEGTPGPVTEAPTTTAGSTAPDGAASTEGPTEGPPTDEPDGLGEVPAGLARDQAAAASFAAQLAALAPEQVWWLPVGDVDTTALMTQDVDVAAIGELVGRELQVAAPTTRAADGGPSPAPPPFPESTGATESATDPGPATTGGTTIDTATGGSTATTEVTPEPADPTAVAGGVVPSAGALLAEGRRDVAWPVPATLRNSQIRVLQQAWSEAGEDTAPLSAVVVPAATIAGGDGLTDPAVWRHPSGPALLAHDEVLGAILAGTGGEHRQAAAVQRLMAETLAIYQERPAVDRSLLVVLPRGFTTEPEVLQAAVEATAAAPWLEPTSAHALLAGVDQAPESTLQGAPATLAGDLAPYPVPADSPLTAARVDDIEQTRDDLAGVASALPGGGRAAATWDPVLDGLYSARWRQDPSGWRRSLVAARDVAAQVVDGLHISPTTINFYADEGLIRVTVVNDLPVEVSGLSLSVTPGNARLQIIEEPEPITIGPGSRATVSFRARAIASGQVPLDLSLSTPGGTEIGSLEQVQVRVQPTGVWIYWVLGAAAGAILVLGLVRALRPRRPQTTPSVTTAPQEST